MLKTMPPERKENKAFIQGYKSKMFDNTKGCERSGGSDVGRTIRSPESLYNPSVQN